ncbi:MAG: C45 family peptidase [Ignavibacteria bacterium]|nr:C45 family peptidase [Ignavibacteria bacterium]
MKNSFKICIVFTIVLTALGCTLWSSAGTSVTGGGTLIAKNRDKKEFGFNSLRIYHPKHGLRYLAMFAQGEKGGVKGGINEKHFAVFTASAGSVSADDSESELPGSLRKMLSTASSVADIYNAPEKYLNVKPQFFMLADAFEIAWIEIGPDGQFRIEKKSNGSLWHTNHYVADDFRFYNNKISRSSETRYNRIAELLGSHEVLSLQDYIAFSDDRIAGPDDSICRTGSKPQKARTLMTVCIHITATSAPELYVKTRNIDYPAVSKTMVLDSSFWQLSGDILI